MTLLFLLVHNPPHFPNHYFRFLCLKYLDPILIELFTLSSMTIKKVFILMTVSFNGRLKRQYYQQKALWKSSSLDQRKNLEKKVKQQSWALIILRNILNLQDVCFALEHTWVFQFSSRFHKAVVWICEDCNMRPSSFDPFLEALLWKILIDNLFLGLLDFLDS